MNIPQTIYLYRIIHEANLDYILKTGKIVCPNHKLSDPDYVNIGDSTLISSRRAHTIPIPPKGSFSDYVSFYFGNRSPMLYGIQKGFNNVTKHNPDSIIYLVTTFDKIKESELKFVFTDGHGYHQLTRFFNVESDLGNVDWSAVKNRQWNDTEGDPDRKRRKQAEFLVHSELPTDKLAAIVVYDDVVKSTILTKFVKLGVTLTVVVKPNWYY